MTELPPTISYAVDPSHEAPAEYDVACENCGESIISVSGDRCVRCGHAFDPSVLPLARVPWLYRHRYGAVPAYVRTFWRIMRGPVAFGRELCRPVRISIADARQFRMLTIWFATCCTVSAMMVIDFLFILNTRLSFGQAVTLVVLPVVSVFTLRGYFGLISDLPTFIWHGARDRPDELQPIHLYACAPLAMMSLVAIAGVSAAAVEFYLRTYEPIRVMQYVLLGIALVVTVVAWYVMPIRFAIAAGLPGRRLLLLAAYWPVHAVMAAFIFGSLTILITAGITALAEAFS